VTQTGKPARRKARGLSALLRRLRLNLTDIRRGLRDIESGQIVLCALLGGAIGLLVALLREGVMLLHSLDFGIAFGTFLSSGIGMSRGRLLFVPLLGGLLLGLAARYRRAHRPADAGELVDPIEANAMHGGRMSLRDSLWLTFTTFLSNGAGASLGMEAGYTQLGAAIYSRVGQTFRLRRADLRIFVTAGAAASIAAAFNAPLAGAFYGFELILGSYNVRALAPVIVASVCGALAQRSFSHMQALFDVASVLPVTTDRSYLLFVLLGLGAAAIAVLAMQAVSWTERGLRHSKLPDWLRPALGGLVLSGIAFYAPQVLGSGHGAVQFHFDIRWSLPALALLLAAKLVASAISVGSGFRGGLFSSSLFLGTLYGAVFAQAAALIAPGLEQEHATFMLAGMGAVAAAVVGAPLTMVFLVLEGTGDFPVTIAVVIAVTVAATLVRMLFGYSFATWRFHLRGMGIRGGHDVGWISDLSVARLMRSDPKCVRDNMGLAALRQAWPVGSTKRLYVVREDGGYAGSIDMADVHDHEIDDALHGAVAGDLAAGPELFLLPFENIRTALARYDEGQTEDMPVLDSRAGRQVIGYMTEAYALKRYSQELERMRSAELGERDLFALGPTPSGN
jgi:CIC family chloride channel protein